jgi:hypothetical protein
MPWQNTILGLVLFISISFSYGCAEVNSFISRPLGKVRSHRLPPCCRWSKEIGGDSAAVIQGSDRNVPSWFISLENPKAPRCAESKGYRTASAR